MATWTAPATFEDFVTEYDHFITMVIKEITKGFVRFDDLAELKQAILLRVVQTNYLAKYNPRKGSFSNYLYWLIRSVLVNQFDRNSRNPLNKAIGTRWSMMGHRPDDRHEAKRLVLEAHQELVDLQFERSQLARDLVSRLEVVAKAEADGTELVDTMRLLYEGYTPLEVSRKMHTSQANVAARRERLQHLLTQLMTPAAAA